jgi:glucose repression mediator protein
MKSFFRFGIIIYKQQGKHEDSLSCFDRILRNPPRPLAHADIWFQIGHVYEQHKNVSSPNYRYVSYNFTSGFSTSARPYLDSSDAQSWDLLGRAYMAGQKYNKAYEAYQQPVYRDGRNPTFWFQ